MDADINAKSRRAVCLPFDYGQRVYHAVRADTVAGLVTGYNLRPEGTMVLVTWGDDLRKFGHYFFELTTEHEPDLI